MDGAWLKTIFTFQIPIENETYFINTEWLLYAPISENYQAEINIFVSVSVFAVIEEVQDYEQSKNYLETERQHGALAKSLTVVHCNHFDIPVFYQKKFCTLIFIFL